MSKKYRNRILEVNILYLILGIGLIYLGSMAQNREMYSGLLITEYILILLPSLTYLKIGGFSLRRVLRLNRITFKQILMIIGITIFTYPVAIFFQAIFIGILSRFIEVRQHIVPMPESSTQYIISFLIMAVSPGICEEIMFRGVMLHGYKDLGYKKSIIITGILFGIFHFTLLNLVGPIVLGIIFGIMVYKTDSIYSSMLAHTINNSIALSLGYILNKYGYLIDEYVENTPTSVDMAPTIGASIIAIGFFVACLFIVITLLKKLSPKRSNGIEVLNYEIDNLLSYNTELYGLEYIPVFIVIVMYIYINWKYIIL
ncbi:CPBP family glutamic-type intramembrane protease [Tissierellaceae bacterium HCP3S3_D8]